MTEGHKCQNGYFIPWKMGFGSKSMALMYRSLQHLPCPSVTPLLRNCPFKPLKFSNLPFSHRCRRQSPASSSASCCCSSSSSSMESSPEGYRRNVGVCLMNPSKKVMMNHSWKQLILRCLSLITRFSITLLDLRSVEVGYSECLANASGVC